MDDFALPLTPESAAAVVATRSFSLLQNACTQRALMLAAGTTQPQPEVDTSPVHMLAFLLQNKLNEARFLWKRTSPEVKQGTPAGQELTALWAIGSALWKKDYAAAYDAMDRFPWTPVLLPLVDALRDSTRGRLAAVVAAAFTSIELSQLAPLLGLSPEAASAYVVQRGWTSVDGMVKPPTVAADAAGAEGLEALSPDDLDVLTEFMVQLESRNDIYEEPEVERPRSARMGGGSAIASFLGMMGGQGMGMRGGM